jgi:hypothetical protein
LLTKPKSFLTGTPTRTAVRTPKRAAFVFAILPNGVLTKAGRGYADVDVPFIPRLSHEHWYSADIMQLEEGLVCRRLTVVYSALSDQQRAEIKHFTTTALNYSDWIGAEAVRVRMPNAAGVFETLSLSREMIIKRVANTLQGSHSAAPEEKDKDNRFDPAVKFLLEIKIQGLSLPYFLLMKIAQDILAGTDKIVEAPGSAA